MSDLAIRVTGVSKAFGAKVALDGVDLELAPGSIVGLIGPNGAGKSTLLRALIGLVDRDAGEITVLGHDPADESLAIRRRTAYLPGETSVYHSLTGRQFLEFALGFYPRRRELPDGAVASFELPLDQRIRDYSAGMKQKLALLATLLPDVELYLLDEPDRALDATARLHLREVVLELRRSGKAVLLSSHHLAEVDAIADRTVFLFDGRHVAEPRVAEARDLLRREVRVRLAPDTPFPDGVEFAEAQPDGSVRVRTAGDPIAWLARLPSRSVVTAEVGATRLEDLYRLLSARPGATHEVEA